MLLFPAYGAWFEAIGSQGNRGSWNGPGDLDANGVVNIEDLAMVTRHFGQTVGDPNWDPRTDTNGDDVVNAVDLTAVTLNFGKTY